MTGGGLHGRPLVWFFAFSCGIVRFGDGSLSHELSPQLVR